MNKANTVAALNERASIFFSLAATRVRQATPDKSERARRELRKDQHAFEEVGAELLAAVNHINGVSPE